MGWARATCWTGGCSWRITLRAFRVQNKCSVWVSRKSHVKSFLPISPYYLRVLAKIPTSLCPRSWKSGQLRFLLIVLSPELPIFVYYFFFESVVCWVSELWVSAKKVLEIWIIILMTSESMGQKKKFYVCIWFGAGYNADLVMKVEVLFSKDHKKPSFLLNFCTDKDLIVSMKWCLLVSYFRIIITTMSLMLLGYQILFGAFSSHLVLPNPYNSHFWVKKITFMNVRWLLQSTVLAVRKLSLNLEPFSSGSYVLTSVLSSRRKCPD